MLNNRINPIKDTLIYDAKIEGLAPVCITSAGSGGITDDVLGNPRKALVITPNMETKVSLNVGQGDGRIFLNLPNYRKNKELLSFTITQLLTNNKLMEQEENKLYKRFLYTLKEFLRKEMLELGVARFFHKYSNKNLTFSSDNFPEVNNIKFEGSISTAMVELLNSYLGKNKFRNQINLAS